MRDELVAIDLETTGLDVNKDAIIEIGAVRIKEGVIIDEYSTMVDPERPIPAQVTHITGITQDEVNGAPKIKDVLPELIAFTGDVPVIAHNIALDMGMLQDKHRVMLGNKSIDTYDLALILMPRAPRYNLNSLTQQAGIILEHAHRALDDARATALFYWSLWERAQTLPHHILKEIVRASGNIHWDTSLVFEAALRQSLADAHEPIPALYSFSLPEAKPPLKLGDPDTTDSLSIDAIAQAFGSQGIVAEKLENFEYRPQQVEVATAVANAFNKGEHFLIEAGTGTGKSLAYLLPAVHWAIQNNQRVVISTNTINLQDQLMNHDIPLLREILDVDFNVAVMKGRNNYLSPQRLEILRRRGPASVEELRTYAKILVWLQENTTGDRSDINLHGPDENRIWNQLSAQNEDTPTYARPDEPFQQARQAAESAHILIVNHALLIADAQIDNHALPQYHYLIVDEAHHLEDAITHALTIRIDQSALLYRLLSLGGPENGILGAILKTVQQQAPGKDAQKLEHFITNIAEATQLMSVHIKALFKRAARIVTEQRTRPSEFMTYHRITHQQRNRANFAAMQGIWNTLDEFFSVLEESMHRIIRALYKLNHINGLGALASSVESITNHLKETRHQLDSFLINPEDNGIYWMRMGQTDETPTIYSAPLRVGPMMERFIWHSKKSCILTSATLRTQDSFDFIKDRLFADTVKTLEVGSPFDYRQSTLLYLPTDVPEPMDRHGYQQAIERAIIDVAAALDGRVMVLFTSYTQLRQTAQAITPRLALGNITVYDQSDGTSRQSLLDGFKSTDKAVLLGTKSFWEGVDIPGESLSALIITRLPFGVPSDPINSARADTYEDSFKRLALPDAIISFRQGFGRLIRSKDDRGIVIILDSRIVSKDYGTHFLEALPDCEVREGSLDWLPQIAQEWVNQ